MGRLGSLIEKTGPSTEIHVAFNPIIHGLMIEENYNIQWADCLRKRRVKYWAIWCYETLFFRRQREGVTYPYGVTDGPTDGRMDGPTYLLIEVLRST